MPAPSSKATLADAEISSVHRSVLLDEVVEALRPHPGGYLAIDCTVNGGGHSEALLERSSPDGQVVGLDADPNALAVAAVRLAPFEGRVRLVPRNFRHLSSVASDLGLQAVDAVLFDLGLSSNQLERSGRGFSFRGEEPLDMRFDATADDPTAADLLNTLPTDELEQLFRQYGEEPRARRVARAVELRRTKTPFVTTQDLVDVVLGALGPARGRIHPATRVFQALRIAVNDELRALEVGLQAAVELLAPGGRVAVITFHSLEDRIVKWRFREWADPQHTPEPLIRILTKKPLVPSADEARDNPRARSAKLRVAERLPTALGRAGR